ncbi:MAG: hypothetical protein ACR65R_11385 [Methylomicrobium sp.]
MTFIKYAAPAWEPLLVQIGMIERPDSISEIDFTKKDQWGVVEWSAYAKYLENYSQSLVWKLSASETELKKQREKLSRKKKVTNTSVKNATMESFLSDILSSQRRVNPKRGRPKDNNLKSLEYARLVLQKRTELEAQGKTVTNLQTLEEVCKDLNLSRMQKQTVMGRRKTIFNRLKSLRYSQ